MNLQLGRGYPSVLWGISWHGSNRGWRTHFQYGSLTWLAAGSSPGVGTGGLGSSPWALELLYSMAKLLVLVSWR